MARAIAVESGKRRNYAALLFGQVAGVQPGYMQLRNPPATGVIRTCS